jgi:hypothetical protein
MQNNIKVQEGEQPAEGLAELLSQYNALADEFTALAKRINKTNAATPMDSGTIADAITERDGLKSKIRCYRELYDATAITENRYSRNEIKFVRCMNPAELQHEIDAMSKRFREIDTAIQALNWATDLLD